MMKENFAWDAHLEQCEGVNLEYKILNSSCKFIMQIIFIDVPITN